MKKSEADKLAEMYRAGINKQKVDRMNDAKIAKATHKAVFEGKQVKKKGEGK